MTQRGPLSNATMPDTSQRLSRSFYDRDTTLVAQELLGMLLVHEKEGVKRIARIVETEAYLGVHDLAAHSSKGITPRTRIMYGPPGHAYVYLIYGMHHCMNVVTEPAGQGSAVLLRAVEPLWEVEGNTRGPGLLCRAMHITREQNGLDLIDGSLYLAEPAHKPAFSIHARPRIGVDYAGEWARQLLRFTIQGNPFLSRK